jgi:hypothetical protein
VVRKSSHRPLEPLHVFPRSADQKIHIFRGANETVKNDCESADEDVADPFVVQLFAERVEVFELRCA